MAEILDSAVRKHREDQAKQKAEEQERNRATGLPAEKEKLSGPTIQEILGDDEQSELFALYLDRTPGGRGLGEKLAKLKDGTERFTRNEYETVSKRRQEFLELMERSKNVEKLLEGSTFTQILEATPELQRIADTHGAKGIQEAIKSQLPHMAIVDRRRFESINNSILARNELSNKMKQWEEDIQQAFGRYGVNITKQEIISIMNGGDPSVIARAIEKKNTQITRSGRFGLKKQVTIDVTAPEAAAEIRKLVSDKSAELKDRIADLDANLKEIGLGLESAAIDNPEIHKALITHLRTGSVEKERSSMSYNEATDAMEPDPKATRAAWEQYVKDFSGEKRKGALETYVNKYLAQERAKALRKELKADQEEAFESAIKKEVWAKYIQEYLAEPANVSAGITEEKNIPAGELDNLKKEFPDYYELAKKEGAKDRDAKFAEFLKTFDADHSREKAVRDRVSKTYKDPVLDDAKKTELEEKFAADEWHDITPDTIDRREIDNFSRDYTGSQMKGKKGGFWASIAAEFHHDKVFKGLFDSIF